MIKRAFKSHLFKSSGVYAFSTILNAAIPFLLMPILTRYLTPVDYGVVSMFLVMVGVVSPFIGLSIHGAISVKYFEKGDVDFPLYVGNCLILLAVSTTLVSFVLWLFSEQISSLTSFPESWLWVIVCVSVGQFLILVLMTLWQVGNKPLHYGCFQNLQTLLSLALSISFVVWLGGGWQGVVSAQLITVGLFAAISVYIIYNMEWIRLNYCRRYLCEALRYGVPLIPHAIGAMLIFQVDRIFITNMVGVADTGVYTVAFQIAAIIELCAASFNRAYVPWLYSKLSENDDVQKLKIVRLTYCYFLIIIVFALILTAIAPWLIRAFVGEKFYGAQQYMFWLSLGFAFSGMYYMVVNYVFYTGKTLSLAWVTLISSILNIVLNYVLISVNGALGAAQASAIAFLTSFLLTWLLSSRVYKMPWKLSW